MTSMPTCPHCGAYVPLGESICSCGATFAYRDDDEDYEDELFRIERRRQIKKIQQENPYKYDFFNDLHHQLVSHYLIDNMYEQLINLMERLDVELDSVSVDNNSAFFIMVRQTPYYKATLRASFDMSNAFNSIVFYRDLITPDFTKMYESEEIRKLIMDSEKELDSKFHHFSIAVNDYMIMVYAVFENWGYVIDFDNMELVR